MTITVTGGTLGAAAAAARLAKLGHDVRYVGAPDQIGGHWATNLPPVVTLPAAWRDLFRKSGRALDAELARHDLRLSPAPPTLHRFADGAELTLPAERGEQFAAISSVFGADAAERWRDLLDELDDVWLALRKIGVEEPRPNELDKRLRQALLATLTLRDLAERVREPHLAAIIASIAPRCGTGSRRAPALLGTRLVIERTFGRWHLTTPDGTPVAGTRLLDVLAARLRTRGVSFMDEATDEAPPSGTVLDFAPARRRWRGPRPALAPSITLTHTRAASEIVTHTARGPIVDWPGVRYDYTATRPDTAWGDAPDSFSAWWAQPTGGEPWAQLSAAALRVYATHLALTGRDVRPANKAYRP